MRHLELTDLTRLLHDCAGAEEGVDLDGADVLDTLFYDLGYDSLALLQTTGLIERKYGITLDEEAMDEAETPASTSSSSTGCSPPASAPEPAGPRATPSRPVPTSPRRTDMPRIQAIKEFMVREFLPDVPARELDADLDFLEAGIVDSLGLLKVIAWLEYAHHINTDEFDLHPEAFRSVAAIDEFITDASRQQAEAA